MSEFDLSRIKELDHYIHRYMDLFKDTVVLNAGSGDNGASYRTPESRLCKTFIVADMDHGESLFKYTV